LTEYPLSSRAEKKLNYPKFPETMIIYRKQLDALTVILQKDFEAKALTRLRTKFSNTCKDKTETELLTFIRHGITKAATYHIVNRPDVLVFLEYIFCLGADFEMKPAYAPALRILNAIRFSGFEKASQLIKWKRIENEIAL
jgi:hypothetical protein